MIDCTGQSEVNYFYHFDGLGSVVALSKSDGTIAAQYTYDAFGTATVTGTEYGNPYRFTGRRWDDESGLYYYRARMYKPDIGRFLQPDPIGYEGGLNLYAYCGNNSIVFIDPYGEDFWSVVVKATEFTDSRAWKGASNFVSGMGDNLSFGLTNTIRNATGLNSEVNRNSGIYKAGEWSGVALSTAIGAGGGIKAAGTKGVGKEFSHWIPKRWGGAKSLWNGNYVSTAKHALMDPYRYRFTPKAWKAANSLPNAMIRQFQRIPNIYKGLFSGMGYGLSSKNFNNKNCKE